MRGIVVLGLVGSSIVAAAQQDLPRFRSGVDVVQFTVTVLDKERRPVTGLTATDFDVLVDGKPRPLAAFAAVTLPDDTPAVAAPVPFVAPDVQTNRLPPEGRLVVISYHSLEDRIVKRFVAAERRGCVCPPEFPICVCGHSPRLAPVGPQPQMPTVEEIAANPRARSAKLRVARRLAA